MRFEYENENLVGKVAVCSIGRVAIVTGKTGSLWLGLGLDGKGNWASSKPCIIAESGQEFYDKLERLFDGKMSR